MKVYVVYVDVVVLVAVAVVALLVPADMYKGKKSRQMRQQQRSHVKQPVKVEVLRVFAVNEAGASGKNHVMFIAGLGTHLPL